MSAIASTAGERPVFFQAAGEDLFGVITEPTAPSNGIGLILLGGGDVPAPNRNRLSVRVARRVAALGYHSLRFDYHGVGESTGVTDAYRLGRPFVDDVLGGVRCLEENGIREIALVGTCFGARGALASAVKIPRLRGVILLAAPIRDFEKGTPKLEAIPTSQYLRRGLRPSTLVKLRNPRRRQFAARVARTKLRAAVRSNGGGAAPAQKQVSPRFSEPLAELGARGTPVLLAYGTEDEFYGPFLEARPALAAALDAPGSRIEERLVPGRIHGLTTLAVQDEVTDLIEEWLAGLDGVGARGA
jgi:pimeloyl-ACP methyl ester carboxylesterase